MVLFKKDRTLKKLIKVLESMGAWTVEGAQQAASHLFFGL
jgi:hypothetical protein